MKTNIDRYLLNPELFGSILSTVKAQYPNVEWNASEIKNSNRELKNSDNMTKDEAAEAIWSYYLRTKISYVEEETLLESAFGGKNYPLSAFSALEKLEEMGVLTQNREHGKTFFKFTSNPDEIKQNLEKVRIAAVVVNIEQEYEGELCAAFMTFVRSSGCATHKQAMDVVQNFLDEKNISDVQQITESITDYILDSLDEELIRGEEKGDGWIYFPLSEEEILKAEEEAKAWEEEEKARKEKINRSYKDAILNTLSDRKRKTIVEMLKVIDATNQKLSALCEEMTETGELEVTVYHKKKYYSLPGVSAELKQKEAIERQKLESKLKDLKKELEVQSQIVAENSKKIFGAGAKAKRDAMAKMTQIKDQINAVERNLAEKNCETFGK